MWALLIATGAGMPATAARWALLVGVGDYAGYELDLKGPSNDVAALRRELVETLGYSAARVEVLLDADATRANILAALRRLADAAARGDFVLVYLSGHGTSAYDPRVPVALAHDTGAFVPVDYHANGSQRQKLDTLVVGSRDLRPLLTAIDQTGAYGLVLIDSCYSRNTSRSLHAVARPVYRQIDAGLDDLGPFWKTPTVADPDDYPYARLSTMTASSAKETAIDLEDPARTLDGKPHGAFTDAVLRALRELPRADANGDGVVTNREFFASVKLRMAVADIPHSPQMLPSPGIDRRDLAGQAALGTVSVRPAEPVPLPATRLRVRVEGAMPLVASAVAESSTLVATEETPDLLVRRTQEAFDILTPFGDAVASAATEAAVADALRQQPWIRQLVRRLGQRAGAAGVELALRGETFEEGEQLRLATTPKRNAHLLVVDVAPSGALRVLYPARDSEFGMVPAGHPIPFRAVVDPPFGMDYIIAAAFPHAPSFYDSRLLADAEVAPGTPLHGEIVRTLTTAPVVATAVAKVVTVPRVSAARRSGVSQWPTSPTSSDVIARSRWFKQKRVEGG